LLKREKKDIDGLTTIQRPNRLHVKRASKIRKLYNLTKEDDVKFYISKIGREIQKKTEGDKKKNRIKRPKIQRLITDVRIRRKKIQKAESTFRRDRTAKLKEDYHKLVQKLRTKHADTKEEVKAPETKKDEKKVAGKTAPVKATEKKGVKATTAPTTTKTAPKVESKKEAPKKDEKKPVVPAKTAKKWGKRRIKL